MLTKLGEEKPKRFHFVYNLGFLFKRGIKNRRLEKTWSGRHQNRFLKILEKIFFLPATVKIMGTSPQHTHPNDSRSWFSLTRFNQSSKLVCLNHVVKVSTNTIVRSLHINPFKSFFIVNSTGCHFRHLLGKNRGNFFA